MYLGITKDDGIDGRLRSYEVERFTRKKRFIKGSTK